MNRLAAPHLGGQTLRQGAALLRLLLLYGCLCALLLAAGLLHHADQEAGRTLLPALAPAPTGLPFGGVTIDLHAYSPEERPAALAALAEAGFGWVRARFDWGELEPGRGVYAWETADAWIDAITAAGLVPLVVLDGSPAWARAAADLAPTDNPFAPPADPADLAAFAGALAARYGDRVRFYQVWDEPNIAPHWGNRLIEPVAYTQLLAATAAAIRAADPDAVVAAAALAPTADRGHSAIDEVYFFQRMVAAGAADAADAFAIQPFGFGHAPEHSRQAVTVLDFARAALLRRELAAMGLGDKPLWAVRSGWNRLPNATWGTVTAADQARYAADAYALAWDQWPWLEALGWAIDRPAAPAGDPVWGFALHQPDGAPAPVLTALGGFLASIRGAARPQPGAAGAGGGLLHAASPSLAAPWLAIIGALALVAWRAVAAARLLPWVGWIEGWRRLPWPAAALGWGGLLLLYHLAVWPPLIGLCWLLWALLCLAQPAVGLAVAAALLPFYYQHKELALVDAVLAVPPAAAAVACLLPAVLLAGWRGRWRPGGADWAVLALLGISLLPAGRVWQWPAYGRGLVDLVLVPLALWFAVRVLAAPGPLCPSGSIHRRSIHRRSRLQRDNPGQGVGHVMDVTSQSQSRHAEGDDLRSPFRSAGPPRGEQWEMSGTYPTYMMVALALFAGGVLVAVWGLLAWVRGEGVPVDGVLRLVGPHYSPNHTALYLLRTLFLGLGFLAAARAARPRADWTGNAARPRVDWTGNAARPRVDWTGNAARGRADWTRRRIHNANRHATSVTYIAADSPRHPVTPSPRHPFTRSPVHPLLLFSTALVLLALVLTGSRGALLLGLPVGALVMGAVALRRQPGLLRWLAAHPVARVLAVAALAAAAIAALLLWDRLLNRQTLSLRIDLWEASLRLWRDHLLLGVGPGGFFWSYPAYLPLGVAVEPNQLHPHNVWLEVATTWGLLGFGSLGLLVWQGAALWQASAPLPGRRPAAHNWLLAGLLAALLAAFAHAQVDAFFLLPDLAAWNLLALAVVSEGVSG